MASSNPPFVRSLLAAIIIIISSIQNLCLGHKLESERGEWRRRTLLSFKETPSGGNSTFDCSPSGPCLPCQYSEKNDEKYRCSETGYRIPFKCVKAAVATKDASSRRPSQNNEDKVSSSVESRSLLDNASRVPAEAQFYTTYRSCIPAMNEEKLSVIGFEVLMLGLLLVGGSVIFFRRKRTATTTMPGVGGIRMQTNPRSHTLCCGPAPQAGGPRKQPLFRVAL